MRGRRAFGGLPIFGTAAAGVVVGHWISYRLAVPDPQARFSVLAASGHGHWVFVVKIAVALALAGVVTLASRFGSRTPPEMGSGALAWVIWRLAVVQAVAFTGMEIVERIGGGAPVGTMFGHHLFVLGLAVQLLVACAGGSLLLWLSRTVRTVAEAVRSLPHIPVRRAAVLRPVAWRPALALVACDVGIRGPPHS